MTFYVGILDGSDDVWGVRIPDLPGCHGGGPSPAAAIADATSAAREWAAHQKTRSVPLAEPRSLDEIRRDGMVEFDSDTETMVLIAVILDKARLVRANISLDAGLLETIDAEAERRGLTRSAFLASAAIDKMTNTG